MGMRYCALALVLAACSPPASEPPPSPLRVFVTEEAYRGGDLSYSLQPGQGMCDLAAASAGLGGRWVPWLSHFIAAPVHAIDEVRGEGPWVDLVGTVVFKNRADLASGPLVPLLVTENAGRLGLGTLAWTGTRSDGHWSQNLCFDLVQFRVWYAYDEAHLGDVGEVGVVSSRWTQAGSMPCGTWAHLYCLEQP